MSEDVPVMPERDPKKRAKDFKEVALGFSEEQTKAAAERCLNCPTKPCVAGCPVGIDIPSFITLIKNGKYLEAWAKIHEKNSLPAICGRVCPQEDQCEKACLLLKTKGKTVQIGALERYVADYEKGHHKEKPSKKPKGKSVAVVGSGPAGLTCAGELAKRGYQVTVFEALHELGGVLTYGIPEFRLPKAIVNYEIENVKRLGVEFVNDVVIGKTLTIDDLFEDGFKAVFIGSGAGGPSFLGIPGEGYPGVDCANEYLVRVNLMKGYKFPEYDTPVKKGGVVGVIGAGNVAMDAARTALRMGAEKVYILYRRTRDEAPARRDEAHHAEEEGIEFEFLISPMAILCDEKGCVHRIECQKMELGEPDESGRRRPVPIEGKTKTINLDTVIMAVGQSCNQTIQKVSPKIKIGKKGNIEVDDNMMSAWEGVFAAGDIISGAATVIKAMGGGMKAAEGIDNYLKKKSD